MAEYVKLQGVPHGVIVHLMQWLIDQQFDTDAIKLDFNEDNLKSQNSSISSHIQNDLMHNVMSRFVENTKGSVLYFFWNMCRQLVVTNSFIPSVY